MKLLEESIKELEKSWEETIGKYYGKKLGRIWEEIGKKLGRN